MKGILKKIIVAVDGSKASIDASMYAIILAKQLSLKLKAVYVVDEAAVKFLTISRVFTSLERDSYLEELNADGKKYLSYILSLALSKGMKIESELLSGSVWEQIVLTAKEFEADMILVGGNGGKKSYVPQSGEYRRNIHTTARTEIMTYASCPVLVVNHENIEGLFKIL